jgi:hypothetical protein
MVKAKDKELEELRREVGALKSAVSVKERALASAQTDTQTLKEKLITSEGCVHTHAYGCFLPSHCGPHTQHVHGLCLQGSGQPEQGADGHAGGEAQDGVADGCDFPPQRQVGRRPAAAARGGWVHGLDGPSVGLLTALPRTRKLPSLHTIHSILVEYWCRVDLGSRISVPVCRREQAMSAILAQERAAAANGDTPSSTRV